MIHVKNSIVHYINERALTFSENDLNDPMRVAVSLVSGTVIIAHIPGVIDYASDGNFERWTLKGYSTKLVNNALHYIYARLSRTDRTALIVFSVNRYNVDGSITSVNEADGTETTTDPSTDYYYIKIGELTGTDGSSFRELTYDSGLLGTKKGDEASTEMNDMWELDKNSTPWLIRAKQWLSSFTVKGFITLVGGIVFRNGKTEKTVTDVRRSTDTDMEASDESVPTTKYISDVLEDMDEKFIRKDRDDSTPHNLGVGKNLSVGEDLAVTGDADIEGEANVAGNVSLGANLSVDGDSETKGNASVGNVLSVGGNAVVGGNAEIWGDVNAGGKADIKGSASVAGDVSVGGDVVSKDFAQGTLGGGYAVRNNGKGRYENETDIFIARVLSKVYDLLVEHDAVFKGSLSSEEFVSGFLSGKGWSIRMKEWINAAGVTERKSVAEFDDLIVRGAMRVYEFIVSQMLGENDNRIFTGMMEVDHYDELTERIYLKTDGGKLYNPFRKDDVIIVQQYGGNPSEENGYYITKQYELIVTAVGVGEPGEDRLDWVEFRDFTTSMEGGDRSLIAERDTLVRLDNISDPARKGIIQMMSVGEDTPYMDFVYGAKTDPDNSLKARFGNLGGVYNPLFGWLREFGAYITNLYAVGEFRIAHTGEDVADAIEVSKGLFRTNHRQTTYDLTEEDDYFTNAAFTNNCEHWVLGEDTTEYFLVDDLPESFNYELYSSEDTFSGIAALKGRDMMRLHKSTLLQENGKIDKPSTHKVHTGTTENADGSYTDVYEEVPDTLYLSVRMYVESSGTLDFGFADSSGAYYSNAFRYSMTLEAQEDAYEVNLSGTWDGKGDFLVKSSGDIYIDRLSLTDRPLDNFRITTETAIEQNAERISLVGRKVNGVEGSVTNLGIELNAAEERITAYVDKEVDGVEASVSRLQVDVDGITSRVSSAEGDIKDAQAAADAAQQAAEDAAADALAAQNTADAAGKKADANATAISQNSQSISAIAAAFTKDADGNYILTSAAGAVITSEVARLYATKTDVNALGQRVSTAESSITAMAGQIELKASQSFVDALSGELNTAKSSISKLQVDVQGISSTVSSLEGQVEDAEDLADAAKKAADSAASAAAAAQSKADANATAISQNSQSISAIAAAFTKDANGNYILTSAAGAVITSEVARIYAKQTDMNALGERVSTAEASITTTANNLTAFTQKVKFDASGNITNIDKSGLVLDSEFASLFTTQVTSQGVAKKSEVTTMVEDGISKAKINADQVYLNGYTVINDHFTVDTYGNVTMHDFTANNASINGELNVSKDDSYIYIGPNGYNNTPSIEFNKDGTVYAYLGMFDKLGVFTGGSIFLHDTSGGNLDISTNLMRMEGLGYSCTIQPGGIALYSDSDEKHVFMDNEGLTLGDGASISNLAIGNLGTMTNSKMYDFNLIGSSVSMPSPALNKGRVVFVKGTSDSAELLCAGKFIPRDQYGVSDSVKIYKGARIFVSDGTYWYEFHCA